MRLVRTYKYKPKKRERKQKTTISELPGVGVMDTQVDDTTQIRIIRAEAQEAVSKQMEPVMDTIRTTAKEIKRDIKDEMHRHFATKAEIAELKYGLRIDTEKQVEDLIADCAEKNHTRPSRMPSPKGLSNKTIAGISGLILAVGGGVWKLVEYFSR